MENHQAGLKGRLKLLVSFFIVSAFVMTGCQTVTMPDMSNFNLGLSDPGQTVTVKQKYDTVNVRPTPSTNQKPVAVLRGGDQVTLKSEHGNWLNITFYDTAGNDQVGWIYKYLVDGYEKSISETFIPKPNDTDKAFEVETPSETDNTKDNDISIL